jgi:hypothetical protein
MDNRKDIINRTKRLLYCGFALFGGTLTGMYAFTANRFRMDEIFFLVIGGIIAGLSLAMIFCSIVSLVKEQK